MMDTWQEELDVCDKRHRDVMRMIHERSSAKPSSPFFITVTEQIRQSLGQLTPDFEALSRKLQNATELTDAERNRRRHLLDGLKCKHQRLEDLLNEPSSSMTGHGSQRSRLLEDGITDLETTHWDSNEMAGETQLRHEQVLASQDEGLDSLHQVIVSQKRIAAAIGSEVEIQNEILDDIGDGMDQATQRLIETTQNVRGVGRRDSTFRYWLVIVVLFILIVIFVSI
jgi:syntaxin 8